MKKVFPVLLILLSLILSTSARAEGKRGMKVVPKENRFALLVGINKYPRPFTSLKYCDADMKALEKSLLAIGFLPENIVRLSTSATDTELLPTRMNILRQARLITGMADQNSMLIMAFSGHGGSSGEESYFCPMDAVNQELNSLIRCGDLYAIVEKCPAKQKLVFVDACRNSLVMDGWKSASGLKSLVDPAGIENPGFFVISSCKTGQFSWENASLGHGVFTHFLVEGLQGKAAQDGKISVLNLFSYVNYQTKQFVRLNYSELQVPLLRGDEDELDDFLLATLRRDDVPVVQRTSSSATETTLPASLEAGTRKVFTVDGIDYAFRWCPPGEFIMGSTASEWPDRPSYLPYDETPHKVKITRGFWLLETEVTQAMWESVMGSNPSYFKGSSNPVENVSWNDCQEFCRKLGQKLGQQVQLPTEAQWEYACRAGTTGAYAGSLDDMGWYSSNSDSKTHAVGLKKPNAWGLYDMHGNVRERCLDWYDKDYYSESPTSDPSGPNSGANRVHRGGGWNDRARNCRSAGRSRYDPGIRDYDLGGRALLVPVQ